MGPEGAGPSAVEGNNAAGSEGNHAVGSEGVAPPAVEDAAGVEGNRAAGSEAAASVVEGNHAAGSAGAAPSAVQGNHAAGSEGADPSAVQGNQGASAPSVSQGAGRAGGPHVHATPVILAKLNPPTGYKLRLSFNDHRFKVDIVAELEQQRCGRKSYSRSFAAMKGSWKDVLAETHRWMWSKWLESPLADGHDAASRQVPGDIAKEVLDALSPVIADMPEPKVYK